MKICFQIVLILLFLFGCRSNPSRTKSSSIEIDTTEIPTEMVDFVPYEGNPVFKGSDTNTWDQLIRERGYILKEDGIYHMWYTGYRKGPQNEMHPGYATSTDGLTWTRYKDNPIFDSGWVEDMMVIKPDSTYYMFAEGRGDTAHMLTSADRIHWKEQGPLDIRYRNGEPLSKGAYGTPTVFFENGIWYLFYEREDLGIWLALSTDLKVWTNKQDEPVIKMGPEQYDQFAVAVDQIVRYKGRYYAYYHASEFKDWHDWSSCVAISDDLVNWKKFAGNPIMKDNKSSPILVFDGEKYRLYTMHPEVCVHFPKAAAK